MSKIEIRIKSYPPEAQKLIDIFEKHADSINADLGFIVFKNKRPKNPKTQNRRIAGLKAECISYLGDETELVKMSVENFVYLMAKSGVELEFKEAEK